jgi:hypothetical protein
MLSQSPDSRWLADLLGQIPTFESQSLGEKFLAKTWLISGGNYCGKEHKNANNYANIYPFDLIRKWEHDTMIL